MRALRLLVISEKLYHCKILGLWQNSESKTLRSSVIGWINGKGKRTKTSQSHKSIDMVVISKGKQIPCSFIC